MVQRLIVFLAKAKALHDHLRSSKPVSSTRRGGFSHVHLLHPHHQQGSEEGEGVNPRCRAQESDPHLPAGWPL